MSGVGLWKVVYIKERKQEPSVYAVSYTHLDVYKRQEHSSSVENIAA